MKNSRYLLISAGVLLLDQVTKAVIVRYLAPSGRIELLPGFFQLAYGENSGALFGLFADSVEPWRTLLLLIVPVVAIGLVLLFMRMSGEGDRLSLVSLGMILGGALGNQCDRLLRGGRVVDFLDASIDVEPFRGRLLDWFGSSHWPAFNVADSAIVVGACLLAFDLLRQARAAKRAGGGARA